MNIQRKSIQVFVALLILSFFSVITAYLHNCAEADFPSSKPRFENSDQDLFWDDRQNKPEIVVSADYTVLETTGFENFLFFSYQEFPLNQKTVILRC
jgi:hypothetical protein